MRQRIRLDGISRELEGREWQGVNRLRVGRDPQLEVGLGDTSISRCHAEISFVEPLGWFVRDLGSTNGTYLNGTRVGAEERKLHERDLLQVGNLVLRVACMEQVENRADNFCGNIRLEATTQRSWEQAFELVARNITHRTSAGAQLLGLLRAGHALHQRDSLHELLAQNLDDAIRMLDAQSGALLLTDKKTGHLVPHAASSTGDQKPSARCFSKTLAHRCFSRGESLLSGDVRAETGLQQADSISHGDMRSVLCALVRSPHGKLGVLHLARNLQAKPFNFVDLHLADAIAASIAGSIESAQYFLAKQRSWFIQTVIALAQTIELRDPLTAGHAKRVTRYALLLADTLELSAAVRQQIEIGGRLHDIGKIGIRDSVLRKRGKLSAAEYAHMQSHTVKGAAILAAIPELVPVLPIVRNHHERWDGRGYPDQLAGEDAPLASRIVAIADSFDAMTSDRPYRAGLSIDEAFEQLRAGAGKQFDPQCSQAFLGLRDRLTSLVQKDKLARSQVA
jgi:HD-GYP domain-containing protein (c-di-GMP phosphodiesterase class II)